MTSQSDLRIPDRSECEARLNAALREGRLTLATFDARAAWSGNPYRDALVKILDILDGGRNANSR